MKLEYEIILPRSNKLYNVIAECFKLVPKLWRLVSVIRKGIGVRLSLVEVVHASKIPPALITSNFDEACTEHYPGIGRNAGKCVPFLQINGSFLCFVVSISTS